MSSKTYTLIEQTFKYNRLHNRVVQKYTIRCIGGEKLPQEKPQLVFIDKDAIPLRTTRHGEDWNAILGQIPSGKSWKLSAKDKTYRISSVKTAVKKLNGEAKKTLYIAVQRTINGEIFLFVSKV